MLRSMVPLLDVPYNNDFLKTAHGIYRKYNRFTQAMTLAIRLNSMPLIREDLYSTDDQSIRRQMAFLIARQRISSLDLDDNEDEALLECMNNSRLTQHFKALGKELNILDPKAVQDIYKTHLESSRTASVTNVDSARHNLASAFVNAFVNAGFGNDKLMNVNFEDGSKPSWVWKTKDDGRMSTAAAVGMLQQWDLEEGLQMTDKYGEVDDDRVVAGSKLAVGILNTGIRDPSEPAMALLSSDDVLNHKSKDVRLMAILGLGLAYAGTNKEEMFEVLSPFVTDTGLEMQLSAMAALSLGLIFVGTAHEETTQAIVQTIFDPDRTSQLQDKWTRFLTLGLALLFFGRQEEVDVIVETLEAAPENMGQSSSILCQVCAWAGSGAVLKLQELLHICNEHIEEDSEEAKKGDGLLQSYAVIGLALVAMGEDVGQDMVLRQFGHLMHYGEPNIRRAVPLAMGLVSPSNPQMKVYDTLSRYSHDNDTDVAANAIFAMGLLGAGTNNARLAQLMRQLASYYSREPGSLFMVRLAQGMLHMGKGTLTVNPFHTDRQVMSRVAAAGLLTVTIALIDAKQFILSDSHWLMYLLAPAMTPRFLTTLNEDLEPLKVNVRVGQAVDTVGQAGRPKTITGWQTQSTPVLLAFGERAELEDEQYLPLSNVLEGVVILKKVS